MSSVEYMDQDIVPDHPVSPNFRYSNFAVEVSSGRLLTLHGADDETVAAMKVRCAALEVRCPVEGCEAPELSATLGYERGDGTPVTAYFSHKAGSGDGGHGPESYAHAQIKHELRDWAIALGYDAEVEAWIAGAGRRIDVSIDGPASFAVEVQRSSVATGEWADRTGTLIEADLTPLWLWVAPNGGCPDTFDLARVSGDYDELGDVWFAGIDTDGRVRLAMASTYPGFSYEANAWLNTGADDFPTQCRPLWRPLSEIGLDRDGFVDQALLDQISAVFEDERWSYNHQTGRREQGGQRPFDDGQLFNTGSEFGPDRSGWSPEERSIPGTRWMRNLLHDRRHEIFLDGHRNPSAFD